MPRALGILALALLAGCGGETKPAPQPTRDPKTEKTLQFIALEALDLIVPGKITVPGVNAPPAPPQPSSTPKEVRRYEHAMEVGEHGDKIDPADLEPMAEMDMDCSGEHWPHQYFNEARAMQLGRASRDGNKLTIGKYVLEDYAPIVLNGVSTWGEEAYHYLGVLKRLDLDVVYATQPEDMEYKLLDVRTGASIPMEGLPVASPSGRILVALSNDEMNFVGIDIAERTATGLTSIKQIDVDIYPCGLKWVSDTKATFRERVLGTNPVTRSSEYQLVPGSATLELIKGEWVYTPVKK